MITKQSFLVLNKSNTANITISNNSGSDKGYIQISFTLYDADGNNIGTALANTNNLKDGGTWKFEAIALENDVKSFELDEVSGF